jgi:phosphopantothenoylcysteine decarboxylase / phosphopantothenate---cysteine ligase
MLQRKNILITAGPTREAIDPVRYISNHSSGKMGYAIADVCLQNGANVTLVSGPVCISLLHENLNLVQVQSANEMYLACCRYFEEADIVVFAAAVADYRPAIIANQKIKKSDEEFFIRMVKNIDIAYEFGQIKQPHQLSVGFALETTNELQHAIGKLEKKNFDMVVLNSMNDAQAGFGFDTNKISIIRDDLTKTDFDLKTKKEVAFDIVSEAARLCQTKEKLKQSLV